MHFKEVLASIYCGLTDVECLRLASRHINGHLNHEMTYGDYVSFELSSEEITEFYRMVLTYKLLKSLIHDGQT